MKTFEMSFNKIFHRSSLMKGPVCAVTALLQFSVQMYSLNKMCQSYILWQQLLVPKNKPESENR